VSSNAFDPLLDLGLEPGRAGFSGANEATNVAVAAAGRKMEALKVDQCFRLFAIMAKP
jgi:hypothetical protein